MSDPYPSGEAQCQALVEGKAYELALASLPRDQFGRPQYRRVFNVTKKQVEKYAIEHYRLKDLVRMSPGQDDAFYAIPEGEGFLTYYQDEKGIRSDILLVRSVGDVWRLVIDHLLRRSGTGLNFE